MPEELSEDFRTSGLTHLLAVSGTNLTLVVGSMLLLARWAGVRAEGWLVVGALGVVGFVLLARTEPSVVRAAAMGAVGLIGTGPPRSSRGAPGRSVPPSSCCCSSTPGSRRPWASHSRSWPLPGSSGWRPGGGTG